MARTTGSSQDVDNYLSIDGDGVVTLRVGLVEFGQGIETGFMQLVAEELYVPCDSVKTIMGNTAETTANLGTFATLSTRFTGPIIRGAGADAGVAARPRSSQARCGSRRGDPSEWVRRLRH